MRRKYYYNIRYQYFKQNAKFRNNTVDNGN